MITFRPKYSTADIKGYLQDQESQHVIINNWNHHTLIKFQKWGILIVKIVTKHFGNNLVNKKSQFFPRKKLYEIKVIRKKHLNSLVINGHVMVTWKTFNTRASTYQKLNQLIKVYKQPGMKKH